MSYAVALPPLPGGMEGRCPFKINHFWPVTATFVAVTGQSREREGHPEGSCPSHSLLFKQALRLSIDLPKAQHANCVSSVCIKT
jgi:hypothetical protein